MQITWFGHSAFRLDFGGNAVLIDPFFTGNPAFVSDKAAAIKDVKHIVLTHGHARSRRRHARHRPAERRDRHGQLRSVHVARRQGPRKDEPDEYGRHDPTSGDFP